jgi:hypothetical protein
MSQTAPYAVVFTPAARRGLDKLPLPLPGHIPVPPGIAFASLAGARRPRVQQEGTVHTAQFVAGYFKAGFEQGCRVEYQRERAVGVTGGTLHHAERPRASCERTRGIGVLCGRQRTVSHDLGQFGFRCPDDFMLGQGVDVG